MDGTTIGIAEERPAWNEGTQPRATARELVALRREIAGALRDDLGAAAAGPRLRVRWAAELERMARFWRLSPLNRVLVHVQRPGATLVLPAAAWERAGRTVRPGEEPVLVLTPARGRAMPYLAAPVFDVDQTTGEPLRERRLSPRARTAAIEEAAAALGARRGTTLARLAARRLGEERAVDRPLRALEIDSAGFVVLRALGASPRAPAPAALAGRSGAEILLSLSRIQRAARAIVSASRALDP